MGNSSDNVEEASDALETRSEPANGAVVDSQEELPLAEKSIDEEIADFVFQLTVKLPREPYQIQVMVSTQEQVQDVRQSIIECPGAFQYSCFHLEHHGKRINDFIPLSEVEDFTSQSEISLVEDPYTEKDARMHVIRIRELLGSVGDRTDTVYGALAGTSLFSSVLTAETRRPSLTNGTSETASSAGGAHAMVGYDFESPGLMSNLLPPNAEQSPKVVKSLSLSPWNPPPYCFRSRGHLLYLLLTTMEGEQHQITASVSGFFTNKCSNTKFDPLPRLSPRSAAAHSLLSLIAQLSPSFGASFTALQECNGQKDPLATFPLTNAIPASPWVLPPPDSSLCAHLPDLTRTQESYLVSGVENAETLRDWNEEFQSTRELPKETMQERVFKERLTSKLYADYNEAAVRGAVLVARGEVPALNPTENAMGQIYLYNNVFLTLGADGAGTFASEGGDEAARVATGKDVAGVRAVNQLDIDGLFSPGTVVVDYLGRRIVGQTIVPGIFKQREAGEHQIDYGAVDGKDIVAADEAFVPLFEKMSQAMKVKRHSVWDKEGKKHELEASVETKGLLGTDGRKYGLDLYRITPLDINWIEKHYRDPGLEDDSTKRNGVQSSPAGYPHRMSVLRPELIDAYHRVQLRGFVAAELDRRKADGNNLSNGALEDHEPQAPEQNKDSGINEGSEHSTTDVAGKKEQHQAGTGADPVDISSFQFALNPDVFNGQRPQTDQDIEMYAQDERDVRSACEYLVSQVIPQLIHDLSEGDVGFPMDGKSLTRLLHRRGVNVRYLGDICERATKVGPRLQALKEIAEQEMISRAFKHAAIQHLRFLPAAFAGACIAHLLNCLLGDALNQRPVAEVDEELRSLYPETEFGYLKQTPASFQTEIVQQVSLRYRYNLDKEWVSNIKHVQLLREIALKLGLQLEAKQYNFGKCACLNEATVESVNGEAKPPATNGHAASNGKKKKKNGDHAVASSAADDLRRSTHTFLPEDIINIVPVVKDASPKSTLAEETFEAGRISFAQDQKDLGQELLLESLSLHEQIYGILHPEVSRFYSQLSMFYYQLDEKNTAVEIARKAVIVSERTLGLDSAETILCYLNLGLFEHGIGNTDAALKYVRHALELWKVVYGNNHPDAITTTNNVAVMLQHLKHNHDSRLWFEASLRISEPIYGRQSLNHATVLFQLAQALAMDHDAKAAVHRMRESYNIFLNQLGPNDKNTKEAEGWLEQLTQNAVAIAKHAKDLQARRIRRIYLSPRVTLGTRPQLDAGQSSSEATNGAQPGGTTKPLDPRSVEELLQFIEGGQTGTKRTTPRKKPGRSNPKQRSGLAVSAAV